MRGGSFAPHFSEELLDRYAELCIYLDGQAREYFENLLRLAEQWWDIEESDEAPIDEYKDAKGVIGKVIPLSESLKDRMYENIPWQEELEVLGKVFDKFEGETRDAAFHLLWLATELCLDREPLFKRK